jgi:putative transposase
MFGAMIRAAERWRSIKFTDFEHPQMVAIREELDQEYKTQTGLAKQTSKDATADNLSSRNRT